MTSFRIDVETDGNVYTAHLSDSNDKDILALDASLTTTINKSGSLTFTIAPSNNAYNHIKKIRSIVTVYRDEVALWKGRVLETEKDFYNKLTVTCEGWLSVLMDSVVMPMGDPDNPPEFGLEALFQMLINNHNAQVIEYSSGENPVITNSDKVLNVRMHGIPSYVGVFPIGNYETTLDYIQENLVAEHGGRIWVADNNIFWYGDEQIDPSYQSIVFGENLLDLSEHIDASDIYTVLVATGSIPSESNES